MDGNSPVIIYLYSDEFDPVVHQAVALGARVLLQLAHQLWVDRVARIRDPENDVWNIAIRIGEAWHIAELSSRTWQFKQVRPPIHLRVARTNT